jgi:hypothetical protein
MATKQSETSWEPTPPPVLGPPLSLYSPPPRSARADHEEEEEERGREGALALPCAPASPARVRVSLGGPAFLVRRLLALADPPARRAGAPSGVSAFVRPRRRGATASQCRVPDRSLWDWFHSEVASQLEPAELAVLPCRYGVFWGGSVRDPEAGEMQHDQRKKVGSDLYVSRSLRCQFGARLSLSRRDSAAPATVLFRSFLVSGPPAEQFVSLLRFRWCKTLFVVSKGPASFW